jgi:hypothetical protein
MLLISSDVVVIMENMPVFIDRILRLYERSYEVTGHGFDDWFNSWVGHWMFSL